MTRWAGNVTVENFILFENSEVASPEMVVKLYQPYWKPTKAPSETSEDVKMSTWKPLGNKIPNQQRARRPQK